ncbi:hypothetical protein BH09BAC5_BH09BAC5_22580 [soil metagenome]
MSNPFVWNKKFDQEIVEFGGLDAEKLARIKEAINDGNAAPVQWGYSKLSILKSILFNNRSVIIVEISGRILINTEKELKEWLEKNGGSSIADTIIL